MTTQTKRLSTRRARYDAAAEARAALGDRPDLLPAVMFALAAPVEAQMEDTRDWIMIGGLLEGSGLTALAYLSNAPFIYALAAVAFAVVAGGYVAWCGVMK